MTDQYDRPWKEALDEFLRGFMELCAPMTYAQIDWKRGYPMLNKTLQKTSPVSDAGVSVVDTLAKMWASTRNESALRSACSIGA
ncbi:MAG: hypothetical protein R3E01_23825 [Pirellulaceae bacterium]